MHASADAASGVIALVLLWPVPFKLAFFRSRDRVKIASLGRVAHKLLDRVFEPVITPLGRPSIDVVATDVSGELGARRAATSFSDCELRFAGGRNCAVWLSPILSS